MKLTSSKNSTPLLLIVLVAALLFAIYYYVLLPKKEEVESLQNSIEATKSEITSIEEQITAINESKSLDQATLLEMRKKMPATKGLNELLLNIEETQYVSGTQILTVNFNNYDTLVSGSELENPYAPSEEEGEETTTDNQSTEEETSEGGDSETDAEEVPVSTIAKESLPPELKLITFEIDVASPDFTHLSNFIKEIEKIERIMHIDLIDFNLPGEDNDFKEDPQESIEATVQVTTFYYEGEE